MVIPKCKPGSPNKKRTSEESKIRGATQLSQGEGNALSADRGFIESRGCLALDEARNILCNNWRMQARFICHLEIWSIGNISGDEDIWVGWICDLQCVIDSDGMCLGIIQSRRQSLDDLTLRSRTNSNKLEVSKVVLWGLYH